MMKFPRSATLQLSFPLGQTLALAALVLLLIAGAAEFIFRLPAVESRLPAPSIGSDHDQLEIQVYRLHQFAAAGPVDCIFLGSSMVRRGIDPAIFADTYRGQTGESLRCFSLGVNGLTASGAAVLAHYVVDRYHPRLLVYGVSPRDFNEAVAVQAFTAHKLTDLDWTQYQRGSFNFPGWLFDHSAAFGYAYLYRNWMQPDFPERVNSRYQEEASTRADGYSPFFETLEWPPSDREKRRIGLLYRQYTAVPEELDGIRQIVALHRPPQTQIVLVEIPLYEEVITQLIRKKAYEHFNQQVESYTTPAGVRYWPTTLLRLIPDEGWYNLNHMNDTGAKIFSRWLGEQIGAAVNAGDLAPLAG
jgi:hypothetical protein